MINAFKKANKSKDSKRIIKSFLSLAILRGFQFIIPLATLPYLVRTIGIDNFGLVNFALSFGAYFGAIIQFGFGITATREIARHRDDPVKLVQIYSSTLSASILLVLVSMILFVLIALSFEKFNSHLSLHLFTLMFIVFQSLFPVWFFQGMEKMKYIAFLNLGTNVIFLISLFSFVKQRSDFLLVPMLNAVAAFSTFIIAHALISKQFKVAFKAPKIKEIKSVYVNGYYAFVGQLAPSLYNNSAVFLLGFFTNNGVVGLYTSATKVIDAVISFAYILSNTFLPYLSRNLNNHKVFQKIMLISGSLLTLATFAMAEWITKILFSADNIEVAVYIQWLAVSIFFIFTTMTYGTNYLMLIGKDRTIKNIALYTSLSFFGIALLIIPSWGIWGAIATLVGARLVMATLQLVFYVKYRHLAESVKY